MAKENAKPQSDSIVDDPWLLAGLLVWLAALFVLLLSVGWLKWGDPIIDTGRELEIPWKVATGSVLYRDMAYNYGPLSPMFHALLFKLFGVHLTVVVWSGLVAAAVAAVLVWRICRTFVDRVAASAIVTVFLLECAFQHYTANGIFNFVLPYSFPAVHGTLLALGAFLALSGWIDRGARGRLVLAGTIAGLSLLCKIEMAFAILVPVAFVALLVGLKGGRDLRSLILDQVAWAGPCLCVSAAGFLPFVLTSSFNDVVWRNVLRPQLVDFRSNTFFMTHLGLADLRTNLVRCGLSLVVWVATLALLALLGLLAVLLGGPGRSGPARRLTAAVMLAGIGAAAWWWFPADVEFAGLSAVSLAAAVVYGWRLITIPGGPEPRTARLLALALFSGLALVRIFFAASTFYYGFYLAVPALILFGAVLSTELPRRVPALFRCGPWYRASLSSLLVVLSARSFYMASMPHYQHKTLDLRGVHGEMKISSESYGVTPGRYLQDALYYLQSSAQNEDTLLVLPEGATINFLSGEMNPTYYDVLIPPELESPGVEDELIRQLEATKVDRILLVERSLAEYGRRGLGTDYGLKLMRYVGVHYETEAAFGPPPYGETWGGCVLLRRRGSG